MTTIMNLIRNDKPESPTNLAFLLLVLVLAGCEIWATVNKAIVPHFIEFVAFIAALKINKSIQDRKAGISDAQFKQD